MTIQTAVERLNTQLPLKARQNRLTPALKAAHQKVLTSLVEQGRPPRDDELKSVLGEASLADSLHRLGADDLVVLDAQGKHVLGAYPVTSEQTPHKITVNGHIIHAMCALDAVSVAPMFNTAVSIASSCHVTHTPVTIQMQGSDILEASPSAEVTVGIRWQIPAAVAAHSMCMAMVFLKDRQTAEAWQDGDTENISLFSLPEAVAFGEAFFLPLMD
ncbi:MAG: organomercurial lyase [Granulosicoccaceae bacterium]|jgi:mercuric reductase